MTENLSIRWFYAIGFVFIACLLTGIYFDNLYVAAIPPALAFFWFLIAYTKQVVYFLVFSAPLSIPVNDIGGGFGMSFPDEPIIILIFLGLILKFANGATFDKRFVFNGLSVLIVIDLLWNLATSMNSSMPMVSFKFLLSRTWYVVIFYFLLGNFFLQIEAIRKYIWLLSTAICGLAIFTIFEHAKGGFTRGFAYAASQPFVPDHGMYAAIVAFVIPTLFVFAVYGHAFQQSTLKRVIAFGMVLLLTVAVILSFTRAAWLSLIAAAALIIAIKIGIRFRTIILMVIVAIGVYFAMETDIQTQLSRNKQGSDDDIEEHVSSISNVSTDPSNLERLNRWRCASRMFDERPIMGWGPGTYVFQYAPFQVSSELTIISTHAGDLGNVHSEYLRPLAETGLPGALIWLGLVLGTIYLGFRVYRKAKSKEVKYLALALVSGISTYFFHAFLNNYSEFDKLAVPMWGFMAALTALNSYHLKHEQEANWS